MLKTNGKSKQHVRTHGYCKKWGGNFKESKGNAINKKYCNMEMKNAVGGLIRRLDIPRKESLSLKTVET